MSIILSSYVLNSLRPSVLYSMGVSLKTSKIAEKKWYAWWWQWCEVVMMYGTSSCYLVY